LQKKKIIDLDFISIAFSISALSLSGETIGCTFTKARLQPGLEDLKQLSMIEAEYSMGCMYIALSNLGLFYNDKNLLKAPSSLM
jgi:hypothetical protein